LPSSVVFFFFFLKSNMPIDIQNPGTAVQQLSQRGI